MYGITPPQVIVVLLLYCNIQATNSYSLFDDIEIFKPCNPQSCSLSCNPQSAVCHATLLDTERTIYQETIQLVQIKFFQERTYNTGRYWPHFKDFLYGQKIINLGPVAPGA